MPDNDLATLREHVDAISRVIASLGKSWASLGKWLRELQEATRKGEWPTILELLTPRRCEDIQDVVRGLQALSEIDTIRTIADRNEVDAQLQLVSLLLEDIQAAGLESFAKDEQGGLCGGRFIKVRVDAAKRRVIVATMVTQERFHWAARKETVRHIRDLHKRIWQRPFDAQDFVERLYAAYVRANGDGKDVPLADVQKEYWLSLQPVAFWKHYDPSKATEYTTDMFSADISQLRECDEVLTADGKRWRFSRHGGGISVYDTAGKYDLYKYVRFS